MTETFECPSCAMNVEGRRDLYETCPYCGYEFPQHTRGFAFIAVLLILLMVVFALYLM